MEILKGGAAVKLYLQTTTEPELRSLLVDRVQALSEYDDGIADLGQLVHFYVMETVKDLKNLNLPPV